MERLKNDPQPTRRPARSRRHASCVRSQGRRHDRDHHTSEERADRRQRLERMIDRTVAGKMRARSRHRRRHGLDLGRLQRQVERRGGTMQIVIEFPAQPRRPRHGHLRRPRFV